MLQYSLLCTNGEEQAFLSTYPKSKRELKTIAHYIFPARNIVGSITRLEVGMNRDFQVCLDLLLALWQGNCNFLLARRALETAKFMCMHMLQKMITYRYEARVRVGITIDQL